MWITADFRLYPPVITANQELVSPTGDHRYRGGTERAHESGPTLETIGLAADVEAHAVLVSAAVLLVCCLSLIHI